MEKAMRRGSEGETSMVSQDLSSMSFDEFSDLPDELGLFPPSEDVIVTLVDVYFRLIGESFFNFLHEGLFRARMQQNALPTSLLYALCATSARFLCCIRY
jgi:hypothetical protein